MAYTITEQFAKTLANEINVTIENLKKKTKFSSLDLYKILPNEKSV
jgi:hypothetical protein